MKYNYEYETCRSCGQQKPREEFPPKAKELTSKAGTKIYWICRQCLKKRRYECRLKRHGLTVEEYEIMAERQNYCCAICGREPKKLHIDHDHETGKVRGLLCRHCNCLIGFAKDNGLILERAIKYLDKYESNSRI
jgi:hypothetical protein